MSDLSHLRQQIANTVGFEVPMEVPEFEVLARIQQEGYDRLHLRYQLADGDIVEAYLLLPSQSGPHPGVVAFHQHNSQWGIGKSEVVGLDGDPFQFFGPELARRGICVLAPDSVGFESRCRDAGAGGDLTPDLDKPGYTRDGWLQYYNQMCYRLVTGDNLMRKEVTDASTALSLLASREDVTASQVGVVGHSLGGLTVLFLAALDSRVAYACASGAACTYRTKMQKGTALAMSLLVPGFANAFDIDDLVRCVAPRKLLLVSSDADVYAEDCEEIVQSALPTFVQQHCKNHLRHFRGRGPHALDQVRHDAIVEWLVSTSKD